MNEVLTTLRFVQRFIAIACIAIITFALSIQPTPSYYSSALDEYNRLKEALPKISILKLISIEQYYIDHGIDSKLKDTLNKYGYKNASIKYTLGGELMFSDPVPNTDMKLRFISNYLKTINVNVEIANIEFSELEILLDTYFAENLPIFSKNEFNLEIDYARSNKPGLVPLSVSVYSPHPTIENRFAREIIVDGLLIPNSTREIIPINGLST